MHHSEVIIQSLADHEIFNELREDTYLSFMEHELSHRKLLAYPPFIKMAEFEIRADTEDSVIAHAEQIAHYMRSLLGGRPRTRVLGPTKPPVDKIKNIFLRTIIVKSSSAQELVRTYYACKKAFPAITLSFQPKSPLKKAVLYCASSPIDSFISARARCASRFWKNARGSLGYQRRTICLTLLTSIIR